MSQKELAEIVGVEGPTLVRVLDNLEQQGLVERRPGGDDRRVKHVYLAQAARPLLADITNITAALRKELLGDIAGADLHTAREVLRAIGDRLENL